MNILIAIELGRAPGRNTLSGILEVAGKQSDWHLRFLDGVDRLRSTIPAWTGNPPDGVITEYPDDPRTLKALDGLGIPVVFTSYLTLPVSHSGKMAFTTLDNSLIGRAAGEHFDSLGSFASYVFATDRPRFRWSIDRGQAFFANRGKAVCKTLVLSKDYPSERENLAYARTLERLPKPIAVFAANDMVALRILGICGIAGIDVPKQAAVLGADDDGLFADSSRPSLSSISINHRELGRRAAEILLGMFAGGRPRDIRIDNSVLGVTARESTRLIPPAKALVERALEYIRGHAAENLLPRDVIAHLGVSRQLAELRFRQFHGRSIGKTIAAARIGEIKKLLMKSPRSLADIARDCGFTGPASMARYFRRETGETPSAWRNS